MENRFMNEKALLDDDLLENVSGGWLILDNDDSTCDMCNQNVYIQQIVKYNNSYICEACMAKINNP